MLQSLLKADKMLGARKVKAPVKAANDIQSLADKARASGEKKLEKYLTGKDAVKSISNKVEGAFNGVASDYGYDLEFKSLKVNGGKFASSLDNEDTLAEFELDTTLTFKYIPESPDTAIGELADVLESIRQDLYEAIIDEGHLPLQGYSPVSETELSAIVADIQGLDELPSDIEDIYDEVKLVFADFARGNLNKLIKDEGDNEYRVPLAVVFAWELYI